MAFILATLVNTASIDQIFTLCLSHLMSQKVVLRRKKSLAHLEMATVFYCVNNELTHPRSLPPYMDHFLSHLRHFPIPPVKMNLPSSEVVEDGYLAAKRQLFICLPFLRECKTNWCAAWEGEIWQNWRLWTFFSSHDAVSGEMARCPNGSCSAFHTNREDVGY